MSKSKENLQVFLPRSSRAAIRDGYRLYMGNFRKIFRASWITALVYAVVTSIVSALYIEQLPLFYIAQMMGQAAPQSLLEKTAFSVLALCGGGLLLILVLVVLGSYAVSACAEHQATQSISAPHRWYGRLDLKALWRTAKLTGWMLIILLLMSMIVWGVTFVGWHYLGQIARWALLFVVVLTLIALLLPFYYVGLKYVLSEDKAHFLSMLGKAYATGLRHWGGFFIVGLIVGLITMVLALITELPANILMTANIQSQMGALQGDPLGVPGYMTWLNLVVFAIAGFIQAYVQLSMSFPLYYLYGSVEAGEKN